MNVIIALLRWLILQDDEEDGICDGDCEKQQSSLNVRPKNFSDYFIWAVTCVRPPSSMRYMMMLMMTWAKSRSWKNLFPHPSLTTWKMRDGMVENIVKFKSSIYCTHVRIIGIGNEQGEFPECLIQQTTALHNCLNFWPLIISWRDRRRGTKVLFFLALMVKSCWCVLIDDDHLIMLVILRIVSEWGRRGKGMEQAYW